MMILRSSSPFLISLGLLLLQTLWLTGPASAKKDAPRITKSKLDNPPVAPPFYFEDSDVILILDNAGNVIRSEDAGEKWDIIHDVPDGGAWNLVLHPFNKEVAYIWGRDTTHWITDDRGESWRSFEIEGYPVPFRPPFSFHAADSDKVIVNVCTEFFACNEMAYTPKTPSRLLP